MDAQRVASEDRHPHAGARHQQVGRVQNLAGLIAQLLLLIGLEGAILDDAARQRDDIVGDRRHIGSGVAVLERLAVVGEPARVGGVGDLGGQGLDASQPRARHRLVGGHDQALQPSRLVQRTQHRHRGHGGAVGVGDDALGAVADVFGVDLTDHQRHLGVEPPTRGVVDHDGSGSGNPGRVFLGGRLAGGEQGNVQAGEVGGGDVLDDDLLPLERKLGAGRAG